MKTRSSISSIICPAVFLLALALALQPPVQAGGADYRSELFQSTE